MDHRTRLVSECQALRAQLKEWEKSFSELNSGRKPGKEDIKKNPDMAAKYKTYSRARDVLDGKKDADADAHADAHAQQRLGSPSVRKRKSTTTATTTTSSSSSSSKRRLIERNHDPTSRKLLFATPRKPRYAVADSHPSKLDPYDDAAAPPASSASSPHPYVFKNAIGPTPQRDGKILGLFDLLSNPGNTPSSAAARRKRKADVLEESPSRVNGGQQTPRREPANARSEDPLQHLGGSSVAGTGPHRRTRTPASEGKRFLLSQFFATPSTMRLAAVTDQREPSDAAVEKTMSNQTPLRFKVLEEREARTKDGEQDEDDVETTPVYLRRTTSFNQRLLTASGSNPQSTGPLRNLGFAGLSPVRTGPKVYPFKGRALSEILRGLRQMEDKDDEDGLDALRELEGDEVNVLVGDSQRATIADTAGAGEQPARGWKKRGQKRTTRRVIMRPTRMAHKARDGGPEKRNGATAIDIDIDDDDDDDEDAANVNETQASAVSVSAIQTRPEFHHYPDDLLDLLPDPGHKNNPPKHDDDRPPLGPGDQISHHDHDHDSSSFSSSSPAPANPASTPISQKLKPQHHPPSPSFEVIDPDGKADTTTTTTTTTRRRRSATVMDPTTPKAPAPAPAQAPSEQSPPGRAEKEKRKLMIKKKDVYVDADADADADGDADGGKKRKGQDEKMEDDGKNNNKNNNKKKKQKKKGDIDPNAHSHLNFRSLKIRSHRSGRAQGRGRGRGKRQG